MYVVKWAILGQLSDHVLVKMRLNCVLRGSPWSYELIAVTSDNGSRCVWLEQQSKAGRVRPQAAGYRTIILLIPATSVPSTSTASKWKAIALADPEGMTETKTPPEPTATRQNCHFSKQRRQNKHQRLFRVFVWNRLAISKEAKSDKFSEFYKSSSKFCPQKPKSSPSGPNHSNWIT